MSPEFIIFLRTQFKTAVKNHGFYNAYMVYKNTLKYGVNYTDSLQSWVNGAELISSEEQPALCGYSSILANWAIEKMMKETCE